jgi:1,4-dihydroxy-6-naphthoate synthase
MDPALADKFVGMYVNRWTLNFGDEGRKAVNELVARAKSAGLMPDEAQVEFLPE